MKYSEDIMWQAIVKCNKDYDGKFFYVVKTVGVYCNPSCKSKTPLRKNVYFFETVGKAREVGFRPCKRCQSELSNYSEVLEIVKETKELIDIYFKEKKQLMMKMKQLGVSASHLTSIFKKEYGLSPMKYLSEKRFEYIKELLINTNKSIIDIACDTGFNSLSAFYTFFKKHTGTTPKDYRTNFK